MAPRELRTTNGHPRLAVITVIRACSAQSSRLPPTASCTADADPAPQAASLLRRLVQDLEINHFVQRLIGFVHGVAAVVEFAEGLRGPEVQPHGLHPNGVLGPLRPVCKHPARRQDKPILRAKGATEELVGGYVGLQLVLLGITEEGVGVLDGGHADLLRVKVFQDRHGVSAYHLPSASNLHPHAIQHAPL